MSYFQKFVITYSGTKMVLLLTAGFFTLTSMAQDHTKFSVFAKYAVGEWKLNETKSDSVRQFPLCIFGGGDRMRSRTMKITGHADFLTVDVASESPDGALVTRQEKLAFDGKASDTTFVGRPRKTSSARLSDEGSQITVTSIRSFDRDGKKADFKVTEVWQLTNDGKSIFIQVNSTTISGGKNTMTLVYDKQMAVDYRF